MSICLKAYARHDLALAENRFRKACEQMVIMNRYIKDLTDRFNEADAAGNKTMRYTLRLRLSVIEGVRNMFYEFAAQKALTITQLQRLLLAYDAIESESADAFSEADDSMEGFYG